jgi:hypothetical protein
VDEADPGEQTLPENFSTLVDLTEKVLEEETTGWSQRMSDALAELNAKKAMLEAREMSRKGYVKNLASVATLVTKKSIRWNRYIKNPQSSSAAPNRACHPAMALCRRSSGFYKLLSQT